MNKILRKRLKKAPSFPPLSMLTTSFRIIFEQSPISTQIFSLDGQTLAVNKAWVKMWGIKEKEALIYNILQDKQLEEAGIMSLITKAFQGDTVTLPVIKYIPKKTLPQLDAIAYRYTSGIIYPLRDDKGKLTHVVLMHEDITSQKESEEKLLYQAQILESVTDAVIAIDMDYHINSWNKGAEKLYGWKAKEVMGKKVTSIIPATFYGDSRQGVSEALKKKGYWKGEVQQTRKDGKVLNIMGTCSLIKNNQGDPVGIVAVNRDITLYKDAEEEKLQLISEVQKQREKLDEIVNNIPGIIWEAYGEPDEKKQRLNYVSKHVKRMLGYSVHEWVNTPNFWLHIVHPEDKKYASQKAVELFKTKKSGVNRFRWVSKNGKVVWVDAFSSPILDEKGNPIGMRGVTMDITNQKLAEEALQQSEGRFKNIVQLAPDVLYSLDPQGVITSLSPAFETLTGWKIKDWIGKHFIGLVHPDDIEFAINRFKQDFELEDHVLPPYQIRILTKKGSYKTGEFRSVAYKEHGTACGVIGIARDITERLEQERRKDDFISMASHELKTPVTSLKLYSQLLQRQIKEVATPPMSLSLGKMDTQINRLIILISDLLDISKIQIGKLEFRNDTFSLHQVVQDVVESLQGTSHHTIEVKGKNSIKIYADQDRIAQVLINFLTNAIKYSPHADRIMIQIRKSGKDVVVSVQDFGIGIDKEHQKKIFDRFYQVTSTTKSAAAGLGIGLYISQEIIQRYDGKIWVKSEKGKGSIFSFSLPLKEKEH